MVGNSDTYIDRPFHRYPEGKDTSEVVLQKLADLEVTVVEANYSEVGQIIDSRFFIGKEIKGRAVLVQTTCSFQLIET